MRWVTGLHTLDPYPSCSISNTLHYVTSSFRARTPLVELLVRQKPALPTFIISEIIFYSTVVYNKVTSICLIYFPFLRGPGVCAKLNDNLGIWLTFTESLGISKIIYRYLESVVRRLNHSAMIRSKQGTEMVDVSFISIFRNCKTIMLFLCILKGFEPNSSFLARNRLTFIYSSSVATIVLTKYM